MIRDEGQVTVSWDLSNARGPFGLRNTGGHYRYMGVLPLETELHDKPSNITSPHLCAERTPLSVSSIVI